MVYSARALAIALACVGPVSASRHIDLAPMTRVVVPTSRWKLILRTPDIAMWVDSARIDSSRADKMVGLWVRFDYPQAVPVPGDTTETFNRLLLNLALDCKGERGRNIAMGFVSPSGRSIPASVPASQINFTFATSPFGHGIFVALCGWLRAPDRFQPIVSDTSASSKSG